MSDVLMPKATAVWLIDNTRLSFDQIAAFCGLHPLEVKGIADGDVAAGVRGADPIANGQINREEIERAEADPDYRMSLKTSKHQDMIVRGKRKGARFVPVSKRQERPNAIAWIVKHHPEISDGRIAKLLGTTKATIESVRSRTHWNASNIQPQDPVALGLCSQIELDDIVRDAAAKARKAAEASGVVLDEGASLRPTAAEPAPQEEVDEREQRKRVDADAVFANFEAKPESEEDEDEENERRFKR